MAGHMEWDDEREDEDDEERSVDVVPHQLEELREAADEALDELRWQWD